MRAPKGFGKNYFSLAAIQATVSQQKLCSQHSAHAHRLHVSPFEDNDETCENDLEAFMLSQEASKELDCSRYAHHILLAFARSNDSTPPYRRTQSVSSPPNYPTLFIPFKSIQEFL